MSFRDHLSFVRYLWLAGALLAPSSPCAAQTPVTLHFDSIFYADNSEFTGPFRSGQTILGAFQRTYFDITPGDGTTLRLGLFTIERAGSSSAVDHALPIVAFRQARGSHLFVLGTLDSADRDHPVGPDLETSHNLLPALAVETLWFTRAYEAGGQWITRQPGYEHDAWFDYQVMDTRAHREKFDTGVTGRVHVAGPLSGAYQFHVVHHGGQQFDSGAVSDSVAVAPGLVLQGAVGPFGSTSLELYLLAAYDRPDRANPSATIEGKAVFLRMSAEASSWRGHLVVWRGDNFNHEDGDPNYLSRRPDGSPFRRIRDYSEVGLTRRFRPAKDVDFEGSFRLHRIEANYTYSYRLLAIVHLDLWKTALP